jgi:predicted phage terminase large subunit-like protein
LPADGKHLLLDQWREQARFPDVRDALRRMMKRHRASVVLIEDTNQGPSLLAQIRSFPGMQVWPINPVGGKVDRARAHQAVIRRGAIQLPSDAIWREAFVAEWKLFPCAGYDDQVDATVQYLEWISHNPAPPKRERGGIAAGSNFPIGYAPDGQTRGGVLRLNRPLQWWW